MKREESRHDFAFMAGVVIGAVAGALATLALAPRTGTETRDRWRTRMQEMPVDDLRSRASGLRDVATARTGQLREAASSASASDVLQTTRSRVTEMVDRSPLPVTLSEETAEEAEEVADSLAAAADEGHEAAAETGAGLADEADTVIDETAGGVAESVGGEPDEEAKPEPRQEN